MKIIIKIIRQILQIFFMIIILTSSYEMKLICRIENALVNQSVTKVLPCNGWEELESSVCHLILIRNSLILLKVRARMKVC